ncbi:unnamed protein product, partial [Vitis vinifera]|uniref:Uncharacterized protein n=1 Tax=Vitis vinifera TaxID=29760 RepID=D7T636_VITVI
MKMQCLHATDDQICGIRELNQWETDGEYCTRRDCMPSCSKNTKMYTVFPLHEVPPFSPLRKIKASPVTSFFETDKKKTPTTLKKVLLWLASKNRAESPLISMQILGYQNRAVQSSEKVTGLSFLRQK